MAPTRVLRFARSDDESAFVLLQVTPKDSRPLDLKLDPLPGIQATATVQTESSISITIRKETQGITQRLGAITLKHDAEQDIELFEWCGAAVEASAGSKQAVVDLTAQSHASEAAVAQLRSQLEELIQAKDEDEAALLRKFRDLLNEKKVKIREQQRVLAAGSFNASHPGSSQPSQAKKESEPNAPAKSARKAGQSRTTKRKTPASKRVEEESDDDAPIQAMDVDIKQELEDTDPGETTDATASVTSDDDEDGNTNDDSEGDPPLKTSKTAYMSRPEPQEAPTKKATREPPPRRDLPFNSKPTKSTPAPAAPGDSETDSDDEL
ncbi:hypothetical protein AK830_g9339 [Neonectria ditissima]|uniref:Mitotic apparatus protein p62 n=1 Tax=Neonectria ditissima TaxID=78410 RepID=A0A0P7B5V9_9HYPO|nr:hypothetical protein AK830_g9339 [Neonectria ditissima]